MRWVVAAPGPDWSVADVYAGWVEALRQLGEQVTEFDLGTRLAFYDHAFVELEQTAPDGSPVFRKAVSGPQAHELAANGLAAMLFKVRPDWLMVISGFLLGPELLAAARVAGIRIVVVHTEEPYEVDRELTLGQYANLNLLNDPSHLEAFRELGVPVLYCPHAYRPGFHEPGRAVPEYVCDLAFVGTGFGSRRWFLENMTLDGLDVLLGGNWLGTPTSSPLAKWIGNAAGQQVDNSETVRIYRSARCGLNLYRRETTAETPDVMAAGWACGPREIEMAACGLFYLRDHRPEGDELFHMLPTFTGPEDASEQLRWWLARPDDRAKAAQQAREACADRTFVNHARSLLRLLE